MVISPPISSFLKNSYKSWFSTVAFTCHGHDHFIFFALSLSQVVWILRSNMCSKLKTLISFIPKLFKYFYGLPLWLLYFCHLIVTMIIIVYAMTIVIYVIPYNFSMITITKDHMIMVVEFCSIKFNSSRGTHPTIEIQILKYKL